MGRDIYDQFAVSRQVFEEADEVLGFSLSRLMFAGDPEELMRTKNAQPAIVTVSTATTKALEFEAGLEVSDIYSFAMGHSVGEYAALIAAQALSFVDGIRLVRARGESMQSSIKQREYAMSACILRRSTIADVVADVERVQQEIINDSHTSSNVDCDVVQVANINSSSQIVLSGTKAAVDRALASLQLKRLAMRAVNLPVSAPFHCRLMAPAKEALERKFNELAPISSSRTWTMPVISNVTARPYESAQETQRLLVEQVDKPVLWQKSMQYLKDVHGVSRWGAAGPGCVVGNLASKEYSKDIVRRLSDATAIKEFVAVLNRQKQRGF
ncbi:FabD/lysophospholipase-like protein [Coemansia reversa NRRL 1564]|uniref:[acyl-carrier-protein] S-malonyltransferase n=1 Tax=Coemansia reversa (strain ATCC 12441 / NRRL 1564) TaxID=763665 RepID=A0A2G5B6R3_COERN|nr:FabD/lysophospholipase-like protein [Coemansia reversa NRRL 1564]|eukprot:PIA14417.1 FabD/lysophospholipase-like protein [Coemansia reversa NRRL 1564]